MNTNHKLVLLLLLTLIGCVARQVENTVTTPSSTSTPEVAPPSELALLMREMAAHADTIKAVIGRGDDLPPFPRNFRDLMKAEPTPGMHIDPITFPTFGKDYLDKLDGLYKVKKSQRTQAYNALVQSCANCHGTHCPGPLMRIKKMYVPIPE
jgi:cytochrome c553